VSNNPGEDRQNKKKLSSMYPEPANLPRGIPILRKWGTVSNPGISCFPISGLPLLYRKFRRATIMKPTTLAENQPMVPYYPWSRINAEWYPRFAKLDKITPW
jgi:hypothetical protein